MNRLPDWIKTNTFNGLHNTKRVLRNHGLVTVCEEARCPNKGHCFSKPTATFMILGDKCTRDCGFCSVDHDGPAAPDPDEPERVALAAKSMKLNHVVVTSVTRDDLVDGGAEHFVKTIKSLRTHLPQASVEVLIPDLRGDGDSIDKVLKAKPDVFNHNIETIPRLYTIVRPQADYSVSLSVLERARKYSSQTKIKSGFMVGLGESFEEVIEVLNDLNRAGCDFITIGQYLRPSKRNLPVKEYVRPEVFDKYRNIAYEMGFEYVASGPLVRSSMNAEKMIS